MKTISKTYIDNVSVRLANLPWRWIKVDEVFDDVEEIYRFATALSKNAPDTVTMALRTEDGYEFVNVDLDTLRFAFGEVLLRTMERERHHVDFASVYIPLGFALDVAEWVGLTDRKPRGEWADFADLTRDMDEGGDGDRWFAAHYVGPSWWVVPFPDR